MLSKDKIKLFKSLKIKKYRNKYGIFTAEGQKMVFDLIDNGLKIITLIGITPFFERNEIDFGCEIIKTDKSQIKKISSLKTPPEVLAIFKIPEQKLNFDELSNELSIFCDDIQNPGNFGTIIRTADWFGIKNVICSEGSVDLFNPKVIQATMGSIGRINVFYVDSLKFFQKIISTDLSVYGTFLKGNNIYDYKLKDKGIIVIGNEGKGISKEIESYISDKLFIPNFNEKDKNPESLNVALATAIVCSEFRRRLLK